MNTRRILGLAACMALCSTAWALPVSVFFVPSDTTVTVGDSFDVGIWADLPDPVVGWGFDLSFDPSIASIAGSVITDPWMDVSGPNPENLGALVDPALPAVSGTNVLLATVSFTAVGAGTTTLGAGYDPTDFTKGFALEGFEEFAEVQFSAGTVTGVAPIPEAGTILLFLTTLGGIGLVQRRKSKAKTSR